MSNIEMTNRLQLQGPSVLLSLESGTVLHYRGNPADQNNDVEQIGTIVGPWKGNLQVQPGCWIRLYDEEGPNAVITFDGILSERSD